MQPHAKHQKDHTHFGELPGQSPVGNGVRQIGTHQDTRDEITHQRRQAQPVGEISENGSEHEADGNRCYQCDFLMHIRPLMLLVFLPWR